MFKWLIKFLMPIRLDIFGSSGSTARRDEARAAELEESQRQAQIDRDINAINALFGKTDVDYTDVSDPQWWRKYGARRMDATDAQKYYQKKLTRAEEKGREGKAKKYRGYLEDIQDVLGDYDPAALAEQAATAKTTRAGDIETMYGDLMNLYTTELDEQRKREEDKIRVAMAKRGLYGSTVESDLLGETGELQKRYDKELAELQGRAKGFTTDLSAADEDLRYELAGQIEAGGDIESALSKANSDIETSLAKAREQGEAVNLADLFAGLGELYGQQRYVDAYQSGRRQGASGVVTPGSDGGYSGTIVG